MKKQLRVQIDFTIEYDETKVQLDTRTNWTTPPDEEWIQTRIERQRNLFRAVLSHPAVLKRYLEYLVYVEFEVATWQDWASVFDIDDNELENVLSPAIDTLNATDQEWLKGAIEDRVLMENTEEFQAGFSVSWDEVTLTEI